MRLPKTSMHQASRSGISNPQTLMNKQPNNKTWFVYVFPSDIKPRFLTNLPHLRVRFHGYVIIWEMAAETNTQITTTNKQIRNAGEVHSTTIGKKHEQTHQTSIDKKRSGTIHLNHKPWKLICHRPIFPVASEIYTGYAG